MPRFVHFKGGKFHSGSLKDSENKIKNGVMDSPKPATMARPETPKKPAIIDSPKDLSPIDEDNISSPPISPAGSSIDGHYELDIDGQLYPALRDLEVRSTSSDNDDNDDNDVFCCHAIKKHKRSSKMITPEEYGPIIEMFVEDLNAGQLGEPLHPDKATAAKLKTFERIIKVNPVVYSKGEDKEIYSVLYAQDPETGGFAEVLKMDLAIQFNPDGKGTYWTYRCPHKGVWRIGFFVKRNIARCPDRPTFGCDGLDINLGIITSAQRIAEVDPVRALKGGMPKWEK